jgi:hypothetical protein
VCILRVRDESTRSLGESATVDVDRGDESPKLK